MSTTTNLGHLRLSCPKSKLKLALDASITTSEVHHGTLTSQHLHSNSSNWLTSGAAWVCRGVGLRLELDITVDGTPLDNEGHESLSEALCKADLWGQLRLRASSEPDHLDSKGPIPTPKGLIIIKLDHGRLEDLPQKNIRHMLPSGGSFADVKPPDGVERVALESIRLKICIDRAKPARKKRRLCMPTGPSSKLCNSQEDAWFESLGEAASQSSLYEDDILLLEEPLPCPSAPDERLWDRECQATDVPGHVDVSKPPNSAKRNAATIYPDDEADNQPESSVSSHQLVRLVDAALRLTTSERPKKLPPGIKVKKSDLVARLSEFAPALWSPEYLPAISQRAVFLPTIAHALSHSLYKNAQSASLRSKIEMLAARGSEGVKEAQSAIGAASHMTAPLSASSAYDAISVKLWQLLQRELFDEKAARRLKPLKVPDDAVATARPDDDDLLEDLRAADKQGNLLIFDAEEDLLDWSDDDFDYHVSEDDLLFGSEAGELNEPEESEDPESLWDYAPEQPPGQRADKHERLFMPVRCRTAQMLSTDSSVGQDVSISAESAIRVADAQDHAEVSHRFGYLEDSLETCEIDVEHTKEWTQDGASDGDVIMTF